MVLIFVKSMAGVARLNPLKIKLSDKINT